MLTNPIHTPLSRSLSIPRLRRILIYGPHGIIFVRSNFCPVETPLISNLTVVNQHQPNLPFTSQFIRKVEFYDDSTQYSDFISSYMNINPATPPPWPGIDRAHPQVAALTPSARSIYQGYSNTVPEMSNQPIAGH
jgi:hypothetical protein